MYGKIGKIEFGVEGYKALFTDPLSKQTGHPMSYPVPTASALSSLASAIYVYSPKHAYKLAIDKVRIMNKIDYESVKNSFVHSVKGEQSLVTCRYVSDPYYQVSGHIEFTDGKTHDIEDVIKIENILERGLENDRLNWNPYLGRRECCCYFRNEEFGTGTGFYDNTGINVGFDNMNMFFDWTYLKNKTRIAHFGKIKMVDGVVQYPSLDSNHVCRIVKMKH